MPKTNSQIELVGAIEELISNIGAARAFTPASQEELRADLHHVQMQLNQILRYLRKDTAQHVTLGENAVSELEQKIDAYEAYFEGFDPYAVAERCRTAALTEVARASAEGQSEYMRRRIWLWVPESQRCIGATSIVCQIICGQ